MEIKKMPIKYNYSSRPKGEIIKYIVIHDTGNTGVGANALSHYKYFNGGNRNASAHYFVDDKEIIQLVDDILASWSVGDGKGKYGITNSNSIGVEICVNKDGNYEKAVDNAIWLTVFLMNKHKIPLDRVVRHYDASRKLCPKSMSSNNWAKWNEFKKRVAQEYEEQNKPKDQILIPQDAFKIKVNIDGKLYNLNAISYKDSRGYVTNYGSFREILETLGYTVDWDNKTQTIIAKKKG